LITELKGFVAAGTGFKAKPGENDDLVSATLLAIRMMNVMKDWDPRIYQTFKADATDEETVPPMPIFVSGIY